jgi:branched-chain amino acid transport system substrate-binding protein
LTFAKEFKAQKPNMPLIANGPTLDEGSLPSLGDSAVGDIGISLYCATLNNPANKKFVAAYRAKYKGDPSFWSECGYTTGMFIDKAVQSLHGDVSDKEKFLDALMKVSLSDAPRGPVKLDEHGNPIENMYVFKVQKGKNGLENQIIETFPNVSQFWKYNPDKFMEMPEYSRSVPVCKYCSEK